MKTQPPSYEINQEATDRLSLADLIAYYNFIKDWDSDNGYHQKMYILGEISKRTKKIFIS